MQRPFFRIALGGHGLSPADGEKKLRNNPPPMVTKQKRKSAALKVKTESRVKQKHNHDRQGVKELTPLESSDKVCIHDPVQKRLTETGTIQSEEAPNH